LEKLLIQDHFECQFSHNCRNGILFSSHKGNEKGLERLEGLERLDEILWP
jgi:hypothetical protein